MLDRRRCRSTERSALATFCAPPVMVGDVCRTLRGVKLGDKGVLRPDYNIKGFVNVGPRSLSSYGVCNIRLSSISKEVTARLCRGSGVTMRKCRGTGLPSDFFSITIKGMPFKRFGLFSGECSECGFFVRSCFFTGALSGMEPNNIVTFVASSKAVSGGGPCIEECLTRETRLVNTVHLPGSAFAGGTKAGMASSVVFLRGHSRVVLRRPS